MPPESSWDPTSFASRIQTEINRAVQRSVNGLDFLTSPSPEVGLTPKDVLLKRGTLNLFHYRPRTPELYRVPLLIVTATTNRSYIFDLVPGQSFVEYLLDKGFDVYMIDWTAPEGGEGRLRMEDYVLDFLPACVERVLNDSGELELSMLGYCMGGVLAVSYAALNAKEPLKNLLCVTTPIDFSSMNLFRNWGNTEHFDVEAFVEKVGIIPAQFVLSSFEMLRPASRTAGQVQLWDNMWNDEFVRSFRIFDRWLNETLPLAGAYFKQSLKDLIQDNKLCKNELEIGGRRVDLREISVPIFTAVAEHDHIVPLAATKALIEQAKSTDKYEIVLRGGHVSVIAGANAVRRLWPQVDSWLRERSV